MPLEPLIFRNGARARNRAWLAPLTNMQSHADGSLSDDELRLLELRAQGGFGSWSSSSTAASARQPSSPGKSASAVEEPGVELARAGTEADILRAIAQFRDAAVRAQRAGFGGVELHGAHGCLLCQFLSTTVNLRTDAWGGSLAGRARLIRETLRAVRAAVPDRFLVGVTPRATPASDRTRRHCLRSERP